jgi:hypothetical protein
MAPNSARRSKSQPNPHAAAVEFILKPWLKCPGRVCPSAVSGRQCFLKVPPELHGQVLSWLTGYMAHRGCRAGDRFQQDGGELDAYCAQNPASGLMTAAENAIK